MNRHIGRIALLLTPVLVLAACGSSAQRRTTRLLNDRLQTLMAPHIAAGRVALQPTPDGARVTLLSSSMFPNDKLALDDINPDARADMIEGLLAPSLMRIQVADTSGLPEDQRNQRISNVEQYFTAYGLGEVILPAQSSTAPVAAPAGLTMTISVVCPPRNSRTGYSGLSEPVCE